MFIFKPNESIQECFFVCFLFLFFVFTLVWISKFIKYTTVRFSNRSRFIASATLFSIFVDVWLCAIIIIFGCPTVLSISLICSLYFSFTDKRLKRTDIKIGNDLAQIKRAPRCKRLSSAMVEEANARTTDRHVITVTCERPLKGRYVHLQRMTDVSNTNSILTLCEVLVYGTETAAPSEYCTFNPFQSDTLSKVTADCHFGSKVTGQKILQIPCSRNILLHGICLESIVNAPTAC